jgi:hypothetical protein
MTTKADFNADEWERLAQAPAFAGLMVILGDRGGSFRESIALGKAYAAARRDGGSELLEQVVASPPHVHPKSVTPDELPERISEAISIVEQRATPEETEEYRQFILRVADAVAHAHKEGGVLGIGGKEVSEQEQAVLDQLASMLGTSAT